MPFNKQLKPTSTALVVLCFSATLAQNNQLRSGGLAGRYKSVRMINMIELLDNSVSNLKNNELAHIKKLAENNQSIDKNMEGNIVLSIRPFFLLNGDLVVPVSVTKTIFPSLLKRRFSSGFELKLDGVLIDYTVSKKWLFGNNNS